MVVSFSLIILKKEFSGKLSIILSLLFILIVGLFIEHFLFDAKFPMERTALLYSPIIALMIYYSFVLFVDKYRVTAVLYIPIILCMTTPLCVNFCTGINTSCSRVWQYDCHTKDAMTILKNKINNSTVKKSISNHWIFEPTINYYINRWGLNLHPSNRNGVNLNSDFIYRMDDDSPLVGFQTICTYGDVNSQLLMNTESNNK
jgi:hypothetical protein